MIHHTKVNGTWIQLERVTEGNKTAEAIIGGIVLFVGLIGCAIIGFCL